MFIKIIYFNKIKKLALSDKFKDLNNIIDIVSKFIEKTCFILKSTDLEGKVIIINDQESLDYIVESTKILNEIFIKIYVNDEQKEYSKQAASDKSFSILNKSNDSLKDCYNELFQDKCKINDSSFMEINNSIKKIECEKCLTHSLKLNNNDICQKCENMDINKQNNDKLLTTNTKYDLFYDHIYHKNERWDLLKGFLPNKNLFYYNDYLEIYKNLNRSDLHKQICEDLKYYN